MKRYFLYFFCLLLCVMAACNLPYDVEISDMNEVQVPEAGKSITDNPSPVPAISQPEGLEPFVPEQENPAESTGISIMDDIDPAYLPTGVLVAEKSGNLFRFLDLDGRQIVSREVSGLGWVNPQNVIIAGSMVQPDAGLTPPVLFYSSETGEFKASYDDQSILTFSEVENYFAMAGSHADSYFAYSTMEMVGDTTLSTLKFTLLENLPESHQLYSTQFSQMEYVLLPVYAAASMDGAGSIWFTQGVWGIGGDIVFMPNSGLFRIDEGNSEAQVLIQEERMFAGLSSDAQWAASAPLEGASSESVLRIHDLNTGLSQDFPLAGDSDRGAGYAVFSPGNNLIAWLEVGGTRMALEPDYHSMIHIASLDNTFDFTLTYEQFIAANDDLLPTDIRPLGWLDSEKLLVALFDENFTQSSIVTFSITNRQVQKYSQGIFIGLLYP